MIDPAVSPSVDLTKAGVLGVAPEVLAHLFNLPASQRIAAAQIDHLNGNVLLLVEGASLPQRPEPGTCLERVQLIVCREARPASVGGDEYRLTGALSHSPEETWEIRPWGPAR